MATRAHCFPVPVISLWHRLPASIVSAENNVWKGLILMFNTVHCDIQSHQRLKFLHRKFYTAGLCVEKRLGLSYVSGTALYRPPAPHSCFIRLELCFFDVVFLFFGVNG